VEDFELKSQPEYPYAVPAETRSFLQNRCPGDDAGPRGSERRATDALVNR
jgi:hypothetical protein